MFSSFPADGHDDVTFVIPVVDKTDTFVVGLGPSIGVVEWDGCANKTSKPEYTKLIDETPGNRLNDAKVDASGRLWVGKDIIYLYTLRLSGFLTPTQLFIYWNRFVCFISKGPWDRKSKIIRAITTNIAVRFSP